MAPAGQKHEEELVRFSEGGCEKCADGKYSLEAAAACIACEAGKYSTTDLTACQSCGLHATVIAGGLMLSDCKCDAGFTAAGTQNDTGGTACRQC